MAIPIQPPDAIAYEPVDARSVRLRWRPVEEADYYMVRGGGAPIERVVNGTEAVVRGLIPSVHSVLEVRSVRGDELSLWEPIEVRPSASIPLAPADVPTIPLLDVDRQAVQLRLPRPDGSNVDIRLRVWWQPSDRGWWASIEIPVNTPAVSSRRLGVNCGLLDDTPWLLGGNIVMRSTSDDMEVEPDRTAWREQTHVLAWEAN